MLKKMLSIAICVVMLTVTYVPVSAVNESDNENLSSIEQDELLFEQNYVPDEIDDDDEASLFSASEYPTDLESMRKRADEIVNYEWIPSSNIVTWNRNKYKGSTVFKKGTTVKGMPYTLFVNSDLGHDPLLSLKQYKSKVSSNKSTTHKCVSVGATRTGPIYGSCCATFVSNVFGGYFMYGDSPRFDSCRQFKNDSGSHAKVFTGTVSDIQAGDALINTSGGHIIWIGEVTSNKITVYEQTPPVTRKKVVTKPSGGSYFKYSDSTYKTIVRPTDLVTVPSTPKITSGKELSSSSVQISWNSVKDAQTYQVEMKGPSDSTFQMKKKEYKSTTYEQTGLKAGSQYKFRVYAVNSAGKSKSSESFWVGTKPATPEKPTVEKIDETSLKISWKAVPNTTKYKLLRKKATDKTFQTIKSGLNKTEYTDPNLQDGTKYIYRIVAVRQDRRGSESNHQYVSDQSQSKSKFTKLKKNNPSWSYKGGDEKGRYIKLTWNKATGDSTYAYEVYRDDKRIAKDLSSPEFIDKTAPANTVSQYQIKVVDKKDKDNLLTWSSKFYAASKMTVAAATPENPTTMLVTWKKPSSKIDLQYNVRRYDYSKGDYVQLARTKDTKYEDKNLKTGEKYRYDIQAIDKNGNYVTSTGATYGTLNVLPSKIVLDKTKITLKEGEKQTLKAAVTPQNSFDQTVKWTSSDNNIVTVTKTGEITAVAAGNATITAAANAKNEVKAVCTVTVEAKEVPHVHTYGEWTVETEADCETDGSRVRTCTECGNQESETIPAIGHDYSEEWTVIKEASCQEEGEQAHLCKHCGAKTDETAIPRTEHIFGEWTVTAESSCTNGMTEVRTCTVCGETEERSTEPNDHEYELTAETQPTLEEPGTRTYTCTICGHSYTEEWENEVKAGILNVGGASARPGETITLPVTLSEHPGIAGYELTVHYDDKVLIPKDVREGSLTEGNGTFDRNIEDDGSGFLQVKTVWFADRNLKEEGQIFEVEFEVRSDAPSGDSTIWLEGLLKDETQTHVIPDVQSNVVTVGDVLRGDVDQNGKVDARDCVELARYLVTPDTKQKTRFTKEQRKAANLYNAKEDHLDISDAICLAQLIAGYQLPDMIGDTVGLMEDKSPVKLSMEETTASPGEQVSVPVMISDNQGIAGLNLTMEYDARVLTPVAVEESELLQNGSFETNLEELNTTEDETMLSVCWSDESNLDENGTLFTVTFEVSEQAEEGQVLPVGIQEGVECSDFGLNVVTLMATEGLIVVDAPAYDVSWYPYSVVDIELTNNSGTVLSEFPKNEEFRLNFEVIHTTETYVPAYILVAEYDERGKQIGLQYVSMTEASVEEGKYSVPVAAAKDAIGEIRFYIIGGEGGMNPLTEVYVVSSHDVSYGNEE